MRAKQLVDEVLTGTLDLPALEVQVQNEAAKYRRPAISPESIQQYLDWDDRCRELGRELRDLIGSAYARSDASPADALLLARAIDVLASLLESSNARAQSRFLLGYLLWKAGRWFDAVDPLTDAQHAYARFGDEVLEIAALSYRTDALHRDQRWDEALAATTEYLELAERRALRGHVASALFTRGQILSELGPGPAAIQDLNRAVEVRRGLPERDVREQAVSPLTAFLDELGRAARKSGRFEEAISTYLELAELERQAGDLQHHARALSEIGYTYVQAGEQARGARYLGEAATLATQAGDTQDAARWRSQSHLLVDDPVDVDEVDTWQATAPQSVEQAYRESAIAEQLAVRGDHARALEIATTVLRWAQTHRDSHLEVTTRSILAYVYSAEGLLDEAIDQTRRAIVLADQRSDEPMMLQLRGNLANGLLRQGKYPQAASVLLDGIARSQALLARTEGSEFRQAVLAGSSQLFGQYALLLSGTGQHERLLQITEHARARNLSAWIQAELALEQIRSGGGEQITMDLRDLRATEVELEVRHFERLLDTQSNELLVRRRQRTRDRLDAFLSQAGLPGLLQSISPDTPSYSDSAIRKILEQDTAIVCLFAVREGVCVASLYIDGDHVSAHGDLVYWDRDERLDLMTRWSRDPNSPLTVRNASQSSDGQGRSTASDGALTSFLKSFSSGIGVIRERLLDLIAAHVSSSRSSRVAVIPHQELTLIPFGQLLDLCPHLSSVTVAPSLSVLALCEQRDRKARGKTLLVGDPTGTLINGPELEFVRACRRDGTIAEPWTVGDLKAGASNCSLIHVSTHGMYFPDRPYYSGFMVSSDSAEQGIFRQYLSQDLTPTGQPSGAAGRLLTVAEIMAELDLRSCRLATLSACESGVPREHGGGEMTGLPTSLLVAGAKSVIASIWPVHDDATSLFMRAFYDEWAGGRGREPSPARALAKARQWLRNLRREDVAAHLGFMTEVGTGPRPFDHPYFTDAFQCYGSW